VSGYGGRSYAEGAGRAAWQDGPPDALGTSLRSWVRGASCPDGRVLSLHSHDQINQRLGFKDESAACSCAPGTSHLQIPAALRDIFAFHIFKSSHGGFAFFLPLDRRRSNTRRPSGPL